MKLYYRKTGKGPALVILHGLYGSSDNWMTIARYLSDMFTVYLPDLRNHGQSPHADEHTYESMSNDLDEMISETGIGRFILAGHSMGGKVAMKYALNWPDRIYSLVILDISPFGTRDHDNVYYRQHSSILETLLSVNLAGLKTRSEAENLLAIKIPSERIRSFIMKNLARSNHNQFSWKLNVNALYENLDNIMEGIISDDAHYEQVTGFPVLFVKGEDSDYIKEDEMPVIKKIFPSADLKILSNAGHWLHAERPDAVIRIFQDQLTG